VELATEMVEKSEKILLQAGVEGIRIPIYQTFISDILLTLFPKAIYPSFDN